MALGPKQMGEAIIRNLKKKTGKSLEEWMAILSETSLKEKKEVMNYLKTEHALGHIQAQTVFERFTGQNPYENPEDFVPRLFPSKKSRTLFELIKTRIEMIGPDVRMQPCRTFIPFYRNTKFAILMPAPNGGVALGVNLPDEFEAREFGKAKSKTGERINYQTVLYRNDDFTPAVLSAVKTAYKIN